MSYVPVGFAATAALKDAKKKKAQQQNAAASFARAVNRTATAVLTKQPVIPIPKLPTKVLTRPAPKFTGDKPRTGTWTQIFKPGKPRVGTTAAAITTAPVAAATTTTSSAAPIVGGSGSGFGPGATSRVPPPPEPPSIDQDGDAAPASDKGLPSWVVPAGIAAAVYFLVLK